MEKTLPKRVVSCEPLTINCVFYVFLMFPLFLLLRPKFGLLFMFCLVIRLLYFFSVVVLFGCLLWIILCVYLLLFVSISSSCWHPPLGPLQVGPPSSVERKYLVTSKTTRTCNVGKTIINHPPNHNLYRLCLWHCFKHISWKSLKCWPIQSHCLTTALVSKESKHEWFIW
jgi:hypothetical protein